MWPFFYHLFQERGVSSSKFVSIQSIIQWILSVNIKKSWLQNQQQHFVLWHLHHLFKIKDCLSLNLLHNSKHYSINLSSKSGITSSKTNNSFRHTTMQLLCTSPSQNIIYCLFLNLFQNTRHYSMNLSSQSGKTGSKTNNSFCYTTQQLLCLALWPFHL